MPTVLRIKGYRFYFYANEGSEPPHIHVDKGDATGKIWLTPVQWNYNRGFSAAQEKAITAIVHEHSAMMRERWDEFFGQ